MLKKYEITTEIHENGKPGVRTNVKTVEVGSDKAARDAAIDWVRSYNRLPANAGYRDGKPGAAWMVLKSIY